jgi:hypothetical protein
MKNFVFTYIGKEGETAEFFHVAFVDTATGESGSTRYPYTQALSDYAPALQWMALICGFKGTLPTPELFFGSYNGVNPNLTAAETGAGDVVVLHKIDAKFQGLAALMNQPEELATSQGLYKSVTGETFQPEEMYGMYDPKFTEGYQIMRMVDVLTGFGAEYDQLELDLSFSGYIGFFGEESRAKIHEGLAGICKKMLPAEIVPPFIN